MQRALILAGAGLLIIGLAWPWLSKLGLELGLRLGRLPGDIMVRRGDFSFSFPIVTCLVLSAIATLMLWLLRR
jgi:DUF2905 family protein